ncbi:hypothetical protein [Roseisalinus antarcticus]|uniref:Uncharacterized protein n=1 Tax=Roseisalinus antarcticus TaxID=254357 RepID=A0A1Y5TQH6_9RHOB|nr:hypothetical protein [Roseisalinus antarcticus]SLN67711.1 hypothetical protein ROA7023_03256 [Roseisalinus antarcticus]
MTSMRSMLLRPTLALTLAAAPVAGMANEGILVSDPAACQWMVDVDPELHIIRVVVDGQAMALTSIAMSGDEIDCVFADELDFDWSDWRRQITPGYCESSEHISPTVFVIESYPEVPGEIRVWQQGDDAPTVFYTCDN